ncbi:zinc finger protein ZAT11-like [Zingiber officinale]|nr:zinc finger protein ZAT11-like [Zingiber officinale]
MKPSSADHETIPECNLDLELLISGDDGIQVHQAKLQRKRKKAAHDDDGMFECKTCHLRFATFQALGGHRTSHMRGVNQKAARPVKGGVVLHQCTVCGARFTMGQALGGHMRRHKVTGGWRKEERREVEEFGVAPLEVNMFDVVRKSASSCQLLELFV